MTRNLNTKGDGGGHGGEGMGRKQKPGTKDDEIGSGLSRTPASVVEQNWLFFHPLQQRSIDLLAAERKGQYSTEEDTACEMSFLS